MTETINFNWADSETLFNSCGLSVMFRSANKKLWEETFTEFSYEIRELALRYPADVVEKKLQKGGQ